MTTCLRMAYVPGIVFMLGMPARAQHQGDIWVGRSADGQLKWDAECPAGDGGCGYDPQTGLTVLPPDAFGGWSASFPGFDRLTADQPGEDLYRLEPGAAIWLQIASITPAPTTRAELLIDPAFFIYEPVSFTFYPYEQAGQLYRELFLGTHQIHKHVLWFVDETDPAFDPAECVWQVTLRLIDKGSTGYADSETFTLRFMIHEPIPGDLDCDQDVDLDDFAIFEACHTGPAVRYDGNDLPPGCDLEPDGLGVIGADLDGDLDVDQFDFGIFQRCYSGPDILGDPACAGD